MTKRLATITASLLALAWQTSPAAAGGAPGGYAGLLLLGSHGSIGSTRTHGLGSPEIDNATDDVAGVGVQLGWRFQDLPLRAEVEAHYRFRFDHDLRDNGPTPPVVYHSNISSRVALVNLILEGRNKSDWTPFAGVSVGWAQHVDETERSVTGLNTTTSARRTKDNLAIGGLLGVDWAFSSNWSAEFTYRAISLGRSDSGDFNGQSFENGSYVTHDLMLSLQYRFGS